MKPTAISFSSGSHPKDSSSTVKKPSKSTTVKEADAPDAAQSTLPLPKFYHTKLWKLYS